jgi:cytochrome c peroxidase
MCAISRAALSLHWQARMIRMVRLRLLSGLCALLLLPAHGGTGWTDTVGPVIDLPNEAGVARAFSAAGPVDTSHPFGQSLGTNGRACITCHHPAEGFSIVPAGIRARFEASNGFDPLFRTTDGSNSPSADVSTVDARRAAYSMLLSRGVIRIGMTIPDGAEFVVEAVDDPYGFADSTRLSLFRRPLPSANLAFLSTVMWDGRETFDGQALHFDLAHQANGATLGHAQAAEGLAPEQQGAIVDLETTVFSAQIFDQDAQALFTGGGHGGPQALAAQEFFPGINSGPAASSRVFTLFDAWARLTGADPVSNARRAIANGQDLFNTRTFAGSFSCSSCHNTPNVGGQSNGMFFDTGVARAARRTPDLPLYTLRCLTTNTVVGTTDPGRALVTGRCEDIGRFKVPTLRGLAPRAPYFHDGSAATLRDVVLFYNSVFMMGLRSVEVDDLVAFLRAL